MGVQCSTERRQDLETIQIKDWILSLPITIAEALDKLP